MNPRTAARISRMLSHPLAPPVLHIDVDGDEFRISAASSRCDFCGSGEPRWSYATKDVKASQCSLRGSWAACEPCRVLIEGGDRDGLLNRAHRMLRKHGEPTPRRTLSRYQAAFFSARTASEAVPLEDVEAVIRS